MNYSRARSLIQSGDVLVWTHRGWGSLYDLQIQAVRFFTQSEYSHVGLAWVTGGRVWCIESVVPVIRIVPLSNLIGPAGVFWAPLEAELGAAELEFALARVGRGRYSKLQAIASQLNLLRVGGDDLWECAEFVIAARRLSGVDLGPKATPSAVVRAAQERGSPLNLITEP